MVYQVPCVAVGGAAAPRGPALLTTMILSTVVPIATAYAAAPIIGGQGDFKYQYMPELLQAPAGTAIVNAHGLVTDKEGNIILTYQNDQKTDFNCLLKWKPDGTGGEYLTGGGRALCDGTPHGLKIADEFDWQGKPTQYLYHANNNQKLTKTTLDGTIVWQRVGNFGQDPSLPYRPTWFAVPPESRYVYLCDGYGSNNVYPFDRVTGTFMNRTYGGKGGMEQHGKFSTNHGCTYDPRNGMIAVSDRANHRLEYFIFDNASPNVFTYSHTKARAASRLPVSARSSVHAPRPPSPLPPPLRLRAIQDMRGAMGGATLPCNLRMYPELDGRAISPALDGPVAVLDKENTVVSIVNVSVLLAAEQHKHPHDATFLPSGDMVVATWAPGRVSYWKKL